MKVLTGDKKYEKIASELTGEEKGGITMCKVLDYHEELGEERLSRLIQQLLTDKLYDIIGLVTSDKEEREKYYKAYGI